MTTDRFSAPIDDAAQQKCCEPMPFYLCMGLFSRFCVGALRMTAHIASKACVNALAEPLSCLREMGC